ncbi:MAG: VCBS repeat-containing protein, partial [Thermoplasmata archaeon]|nr:VCBS repeat-containing protein [Thermoplasmata archaeon]
MSRSINYRKPFILLIVSILVISGFLIFPGNVNSVIINKFTDGNRDVTLIYDGSFIDGTSVAIEVPVNASILDASLNVTGYLNNGYYPTDVTVNIGNDEDIDWAYQGTGYGQLGRQTLFSNGDAKKYFKFHNTSFKNNARILLPRNSTVTSTSMTLEGGTGTFDEDYFVAVDYYGNRLSYIQSNGDGSFKPPASVDTNIGGNQWSSCCMGDFDNDGDHDVIATDGGNGNMFFYEKTAAGNNFKSPVNVGKISTSWYVYDFATGDFTNDGNYDFITSSNSGTLYLFTGNGDGTFTSATISVTGGPSNPYTKDAADFDNDGNLDLACGGYRTGSSYVVWIYYGNGDGTFQNAITVTVPFYRAYSIIADDFNNDGDPDLLAAYYNQNLFYCENNGNGTFKTGIATSVTTGSSSYNGGDAWDYNRDGNVDVIVCDSYWSGTREAFLFLGYGNGAFDVNGSSLGNIDRCYGGNAPPPRLIGAENANLNIGDTGAGYDWEYSGILEDYVAQVPDFKTKLNNLIKTPRYTAFTDHYGNEFVVIPLNFTATNDGLLRLSKINIDYSYTAKIFKKKDDNIISELNEHIVYTDTETIKIYFIVTSSTAGKLEFSDLEVVYNIPPDLDMNVPTLTAYEDTENLNLVDLSKFFTDTDEPTTNLNYSVVMNTHSEHTELFTNWTNTLKFRPLTENWHGETEVVVQVLDSGLKKTYSNKFKIKVLPVNDEPTTKHFLPDMQLIEGGKESQLDLDLREYFTDIENDYLYYSLAIDPMNKLKVDRKEIIANIEDNHMITVDGIGDFNTKFNGTTLPIPIWIYCDDDEDVNTMADGTGNYTRQEILVRIQPVNDPPQWSSVPDVYLMEDDAQNFANCVELYKYLSDDESEPEELILQILSNSNPNIDVSLNKGLLSVAAPENYYGSTIVTLRASEPDPTYRTDTSFRIEIMSVNDEPSIFIHFPLPYADVWGTTKLQGSMFDVEDTVQLVEIKIDSMDASENAVHFDWQQAEIEVEFNNWTYAWDTTTVPDDEYR